MYLHIFNSFVDYNKVLCFRCKYSYKIIFMQIINTHIFNYYIKIFIIVE